MHSKAHFHISANSVLMARSIMFNSNVNVILLKDSLKQETLVSLRKTIKTTFYRKTLMVRLVLIM